MIRLDIRFDALGKTDYIAVISFQIYINFEIPSIENLTEILDSNPELKGLNVTIPYKEKVISYLDVVSPCLLYTSGLPW